MAIAIGDCHTLILIVGIFLNWHGRYVLTGFVRRGFFLLFEFVGQGVRFRKRRFYIGLEQTHDLLNSGSSGDLADKLALSAAAFFLRRSGVGVGQLFEFNDNVLSEMTVDSVLQLGVVLRVVPAPVSERVLPVVGDFNRVGTNQLHGTVRPGVVQSQPFEIGLENTI